MKRRFWNQTTSKQMHSVDVMRKDAGTRPFLIKVMILFQKAGQCIRQIWYGSIFWNKAPYLPAIFRYDDFLSGHDKIQISPEIILHFCCCETEKARGCVSVLSFANLVYVMRKELDAKKIEETLKALLYWVVLVNAWIPCRIVCEILPSYSSCHSTTAHGTVRHIDQHGRSGRDQETVGGEQVMKLLGSMTCAGSMVVFLVTATMLHTINNVIFAAIKGK